MAIDDVASTEVGGLFLVLKLVPFIRGSVEVLCISGVCVIFTKENVVPLDCHHCVKSCSVNDLSSWEGILFLPCIHLTGPW